MSNPVIRTPLALTVGVGGKLFTVNRDNTAFQAVEAAIKANRFSDIPDIIDRAGAIANKIASKAQGFGQLAIRERRVYLVAKDGTEQRLVGYEVTKLLELMDTKQDIAPLSKFIVRVRQNPSESIRARLYEFMEYGNLPLAEDGTFLAYKVVSSSYKDKHTGRIDNSVGQVVTMPRAQVNDNDAQTCSTGLHACSKEYVKSFLPGKLMVVQIAPEDVVSIPTDYNNTKLRCCRYEVIAEITAVDDPTYFGNSVYTKTPAKAVDDDADTGAGIVSKKRSDTDYVDVSWE